MKRIIFFSLVIFSACAADEKTAVPKNLIPTEKIIPIIVDLQVLESHYQRTYARADLYKDALDSASSFVFQDYAVSKVDFEESFAYYSSNLNVIYTIYEAALDSINFRMNQKSF